VRLSLTIVLCLTASLPARADRPRIAVLGVEPRDAGDARSQQRTAGLARALTAELRARATSAYDLAPNAEKDLMEMKLLSDCLDEAPGCLAAIGRDLGADVLLYGHVEKLQERSGYRVWLGSIVVASQKPGVLSLARTVPASQGNEAGMRALGPLIFPDATEEPAAPATAAHDTALIVETNVAEGNILIDGAQRGVVTSTRTTVIRGLPPGRVMLAVESPGFQRAEIGVDIREGQAARATLRLEPLPPARVAVTAPMPVPPGADESRPGGTARVLFWSSLVATGAGVAAFTITGLKVRSIEKEQDAAIAGFNYEANGVQFRDDACREAAADGYQELVDICDRGRSMATVTNVLIGATAVAAVATAVFYWRGYLAGASRGREVAARKKPTRLGSVVVSPELYRGGAGIGAVIQF
jgi:hypothetical protein